MLENSGLVLGVDSSLGLLTRLHNPRHVGVALLVHGRLLHLMHTEKEKESSWKKCHSMCNNLHILNPLLLGYGQFIMTHFQCKQLFLFETLHTEETI